MITVSEINSKLQQLEQLVPEAAESHTALTLASGQVSRDEIVLLKRELQRLSGTLEQRQAAYADSYRQRLGTSKDDFEKLDEQSQQTQNPDAWRDRQSFARIGQALDLLGELQGSLLDLDGQIEQQSLRGRQPSGTGEVSQYDRDPEPPSLSP